MSDVGWRAEGISRARAAGGVDLDVYRRPGFTGGLAVRVGGAGANVNGHDVDVDPEPPELELRCVPRQPTTHGG